MANEKPIQLSEYNPYAGGNIIVFNEGTRLLEQRIKEPLLNPQFQTHLVRATDTLWLIANRYYRGLVPFPDRYYHLILEANNIEKAYELSDWIGKEIIIPDIFQERVRG